MKQQDVDAGAHGKVSNFPGARAFPVNPPRSASAAPAQPIQFVLGGPDYNTLRGWRDIVHAEGAGRPALFVKIDSNYNGIAARHPRPDRPRSAPPTSASPSRTSAGRSRLMFGEREVSTFVNRGDEYPVIMRGRDRGSRDAERPDEHLHARRERALDAALGLREPDRNAPRRRR